MERDERVFMLGEDIGAYGGAFKVTEGFIERFGAGRVQDTPIAEDTIVGMAIGAAMEGLRPVVEFQYADFMSSGFDEITTVLGRYHYRSGVKLPVVLRAPSGGGVRASNFHSTNPEPWFAQAPGLKVICPAFPTDAKGLLKSAIRDDNPCVFLEHKWIYRRIKEQVPEDPDFTIPIGKADVKRVGDDVTIVTYGAMVHRALEAAEDLAEEGISAEVVDLRTVYPLDEETILESVAKTSRVLVLYESLRFLGVGAEVAAMIGEKGFEHLDAPIVRLAPPDTPVPFSPPLEDAFLPQVADIVEAVQRLSKW
jgi:2-oxoisovalerate dehydrogenase E1 component beta subunit